MNSLRQSIIQSAKRTCLVALSLSVFVLASSCASNEELKQRLDQRTETHAKYQKRRKMRKQARDARYDAWYDRVMH